MHEKQPFTSLRPICFNTQWALNTAAALWLAKDSKMYNTWSLLSYFKGFITFSSVYERVFLSVCGRGCAQASAGTHKAKKKTPDLTELEKQKVVSHAAWVLETKSGSSERIVCPELNKNNSNRRVKMNREIQRGLNPTQRTKAIQGC